MAAPSIRSYTTGTGVSGFSLGKPAGVQSGDVLLIAITSDTAAPSAPTGFPQLVAGTVGALLYYLYKRVADGTEGSSVTIQDSGQGGSHMTAMYIAVQGASAGPEATSAANTGTGTTATALTVTAAGANRLLVSFFASIGQVLTVNSPLASIGGNLAGTADDQNPGSQTVGSGATGTRTASLAGSANWVAFQTVIPGSGTAAAGPLPNVVTRPQIHPSLLE